MKKLLILLTLFLSCSVMSGQDNRYFRSYPAGTPDSLLVTGVVIKSDIANIQYCLDRYSRERQISKYTGLGTLASGAAMFTSIFFLDVDGLDQILMISTITLGAATLVIDIDADKWLKRGSIKLSPGSIRVYF